MLPLPSEEGTQKLLCIYLRVQGQNFALSVLFVPSSPDIGLGQALGLKGLRCVRLVYGAVTALEWILFVQIHRKSSEDRGGAARIAWRYMG